MVDGVLAQANQTKKKVICIEKISSRSAYSHVFTDLVQEHSTARHGCAEFLHFYKPKTACLSRAEPSRAELS